MYVLLLHAGSCVSSPPSSQARNSVRSPHSAPPLAAGVTTLRLRCCLKAHSPAIWMQLPQEVHSLVTHAAVSRIHRATHVSNAQVTITETAVPHLPGQDGAGVQRRVSLSAGQADGWVTTSTERWRISWRSLSSELHESEQVDQEPHSLT